MIYFPELGIRLWRELERLFFSFFLLLKKERERQAAEKIAAKSTSAINYELLQLTRWLRQRMAEDCAGPTSLLFSLTLRTVRLLSFFLSFPGLYTTV